jgi:hypothetical protein
MHDFIVSIYQSTEIWVVNKTSLCWIRVDVVTLSSPHVFGKYGQKLERMFIQFHVVCRPTNLHHVGDLFLREDRAGG